MIKKNQTIIALKKSRTLLDKIIKMVEVDEYCIDIIQQNLAVIGLMKSVNIKLLE
jgi:DNA-binding FrmR family transcriptional regulator